MTATEAAQRVAVQPDDDPLHGRIAQAVHDAGAQVTALQDASALVWLGRRPEELKSALHPGVRWVQLRAAGIERWIEEGAVDDMRTFTSARGFYAQSVAEHAVMLMLAGTRCLHTYTRATCWEKDRQARSLAGATVGIVGAGGVGHALIRLLEPFDVRILGATHSGRTVPGAALSLSPRDMDLIWQESDVVVLAAPATPRTNGLIGSDELRRMRQHAWLINVSRGSLVDTDALVTALEQRWIGGAALDVTDPEPLPAIHPLWRMANVIVTPHAANVQRDKEAQLCRLVTENVSRWLKGEELLAQIDLARHY